MKRLLSLLCLFAGFTAFAQDPILVINDTEEVTGDPITIRENYDFSTTDSTHM